MLEEKTWAVRINGHYFPCPNEKHAKRLEELIPGAKAVYVYIVKVREKSLVKA